MEIGAHTARVTIKVVPSASCDEIMGVMDDGTLKVRVTAAPVGGAANRAVRHVIARTLAIKPKNVGIVHGKTSSRKQLRVSGLKTAEVYNRLGLKS